MAFVLQLFQPCIKVCALAKEQPASVTNPSRHENYSDEEPQHQRKPTGTDAEMQSQPTLYLGTEASIHQNLDSDTAANHSQVVRQHIIGIFADVAFVQGHHTILSGHSEEAKRRYEKNQTQELRFCCLSILKDDHYQGTV